MLLLSKQLPGQKTTIVVGVGTVLILRMTMIEVLDAIAIVDIGTATAAAAVAVPVLILVGRLGQVWALVLPLLLRWLSPKITTTRMMTDVAAHAIVALLAPAGQKERMTIAVGPTKRSTWQVPVWLEPRPRAFWIALTTVLGLEEVVGPDLAVRFGKHYPLSRVVWVQLLLLDSTRKTRIKRKKAGRDIGNNREGLVLEAGPRQTCTPIHHGTRLA